MKNEVSSTRAIRGTGMTPAVTCEQCFTNVCVAGALPCHASSHIIGCVSWAAGFICIWPMAALSFGMMQLSRRYLQSFIR